MKIVRLWRITVDWGVERWLLFVWAQTADAPKLSVPFGSGPGLLLAGPGYRHSFGFRSWIHRIILALCCIFASGQQPPASSFHWSNRSASAFLLLPTLTFKLDRCLPIGSQHSGTPPPEMSLPFRQPSPFLWRPLSLWSVPRCLDSTVSFWLKVEPSGTLDLGPDRTSPPCRCWVRWGWPPCLRPYLVPLAIISPVWPAEPVSPFPLGSHISGFSIEIQVPSVNSGTEG